MAVAGWLIALSVRDWRTRDIPEPYTMLPLAAVALYRIALPPEGVFWPGGAALLVAVLMLLVSDYAIPAVLLAGVAGALAGHAGPTTPPLVSGKTGTPEPAGDNHAHNCIPWDSIIRPLFPTSTGIGPRFR